jgi:energy-coupling factor transporter ATP-binding protein EcfA2
MERHMDMINRLIPPRFRAATFANFETRHPSQRAALTAVEAWLLRLDDGPMLALVGKQGAGKSHLLYSAARHLIERVDGMDPKDRMRAGAKYPFVAPWYSLSDDLRYGRSEQTEAGSRQRDPAEIRANWWGRKVVLLDEVRATSGTAFDDTELAKFACHAYDQRIAVLITTNVNPLADVMGPAAASRFRQVVVDGPDARQPRAAA